MLITTRDRALARYAPALTLDVFDPDTAIAYLTTEAARSGDADGAQRLASALGYLPLALAHAAAYCQTGTSFDDYLRLLNALPAPELFDTSPKASYEQTVASTWTVSIRSANGNAPLAGTVLELAAHLAPDAIPRALFGVLIDAERPVEVKGLGDAFNALARLSLATIDEHSVSVHRLLQKVVRDECRDRHDQTAAAYALTALDRAFPDDPNIPDDWPACERLLPHVQALTAAFDPADDRAERLSTCSAGPASTSSNPAPGTGRAGSARRPPAPRHAYSVPITGRRSVHATASPPRISTRAACTRRSRSSSRCWPT
jgi:hypothetical protein